MAETQGYALPLGYQLDDYRITQVLGQGGFGITYRAQDVRLQRDVAIKEYLPRQFAERGPDLLVRPREPADEEMFAWGLTRFVDEARALALFRHPNIVSVARFLEANGTAYLVMEYEEGENLEAWLGRFAGGVPERVLVERILLPLLDGLARVHDKGLLHRDIKPDNIFIRQDGTPVLIDFGASRPHGQGAATALTSIISAGYSPFEQYGASSRQGPWTDLYALAGTVYRVVAGRKPTDAIARQQGEPLTPAVEIGRGRYSEGLLRAIDQALALDPAARPQSAAAFRARLEAGGAPAGTDPDATVVRRDGETTTAPRGGPSRIGRIAAVAVVLLVIAAGAAYVYLPVEPDVPATSAGAAAPTTEPPQAVTDTPASVTAAALPTEPVADQQPTPVDDVAPAAPAQAAVEPAPDDEDAILAGLDVPESVSAFRETQIAGALLAYVSNRSRFDACVQDACPEQLALMGKVQEALDGYAWERPPLSGRVQVTNPRRLDSEDCPFMLDVQEIIRRDGTERSQTRTYCTRNGFERALQRAGAISPS